MKRHSGTEHRSNPDPEPEVTYRDKRVAILVQFQLQKTPNQIMEDLNLLWDLKPHQRPWYIIAFRDLEVKTMTFGYEIM